MAPADAIDWFRAALAVGMFGWAAVLDLRERRVRNRTWIWFVELAAGFMLADLMLHGLARAFWQPWTIAVGTVMLAYLMWRARLLFGGADAKGLMVLALLLPTYPVLAGGHLSPALDAFSNGLILTLVVPLGIAVQNLARGRVSGVATFLATPMAIEEAEAAFVWPLERVEDGDIRRRFSPDRDMDLETLYGQLKEAGLTTVWATPKVPFLVPMGAGLLLALLWGNLIVLAVQVFAG